MFVDQLVALPRVIHDSLGGFFVHTFLPEALSSKIHVNIKI